MPVDKTQTSKSTASGPNSKTSYTHMILLGAGAVAIVLLVAILIIGAIDLKKDSRSSSTALSPDLSYRISPVMFEYLDAKTTDGVCYNGLSLDPLTICKDKCNQEFCAGKYAKENGGICAGTSCPSMNLNVTDCVLGCYCCQSKNACLLKNGGSMGQCEAELPECNFGNVPLSDYRDNDICYLAKSVNYCSFSGIFHNPVVCE